MNVINRAPISDPVMTEGHSLATQMEAQLPLQCPTHSLLEKLLEMLFTLLKLKYRLLWKSCFLFWILQSRLLRIDLSFYIFTCKWQVFFSQKTLMNLRNVLGLSGEAFLASQQLVREGPPLLLGQTEAHWDWAPISEFVTPLPPFPSDFIPFCISAFPLLPLSLQ